MTPVLVQSCVPVVACPVCGSDRTVSHLSSPDCDAVLPLRRCTGCDFVFSPREDSDRDRHGAGYHARRAAIRDAIADTATVARMLEFWSRRLGWHAGMRLLEVGCAEGRLVVLARAMGFVARGIDISDAHERRWHEHAVPAEVATVEVLAARSGDPVDILITRQVIEHVADIAGFMQACAKMLAPGGTCLVETGDALSAQARLLGRRWSYWIPAEGPGSHISFLARRSASELARLTGMTLVESLPSFRHRPLESYASECGERTPGIRTRIRYALHRSALSAGRTYRFQKASRPGPKATALP